MTLKLDSSGLIEIWNRGDDVETGRSGLIEIWNRGDDVETGLVGV
jgi:hypothetical protein